MGDEPFRGSRGIVSRPEAAVLSLLALRLLAWAFLLPPWNGFDEPFHQGYVETCAKDPRWHAFLSADLPARLVGEMQKWPLVPSYARQFGSRAYGETARPPFLAGKYANYETLQSPAYYLGAGGLVRALPSLSPVAELYVLRGVNAAFAMAVGVLTLLAARRIGFGPSAWMPVAFLALVPGFSLALVRVSNDALCALLLALGIGASLETTVEGVSIPRSRPLVAAAGAGLSPWAKLYGVAAIPALCLQVLRPGEKRRALRAAVLVLPSLLLAYFSRRINGSAISLLEILNHPRPVRLWEVPWLRDGWTIAKSHLWISGMSDLVFPNAVYIVLLAALLGLLAASARARGFGGSPRQRRNLFLLAGPLFFFMLALGYFCWKNFAWYLAPGGAGGWYLWAMALPEALLLTWGAAGGARMKAAIAFVFLGLLLLTVAGDLVLLAEAGGRVVATAGNHHVRGIAGFPFSTLLASFLDSRPPAAGIAALVLVPASWVVGIAALVRLFRPRVDVPRGACAETIR